MADDAELEAIRARRMAELQQQMGFRSPESDILEGALGGGGGGGGGASKEQQEEMMKRQTEMRMTILAQVLDQQARARLNTIAVAKPEKAKMVEDMLIRMAQSGQIGGKLGEDQLKGLLEKVSEQTQKKTTVKFDRRRAALDSDED